MGDRSNNVTMDIDGTCGQAAIGALSYKTSIEEYRGYRIRGPRSLTLRQPSVDTHGSP